MKEAPKFLEVSTRLTAYKDSEAVLRNAQYEHAANERRLLVAVFEAGIVDALKINHSRLRQILQNTK